MREETVQFIEAQERRACVYPPALESFPGSGMLEPWNLETQAPCVSGGTRSSNVNVNRKHHTGFFETYILNRGSPRAHNGRKLYLSPAPHPSFMTPNFSKRDGDAADAEESALW